MSKLSAGIDPKMALTVVQRVNDDPDLAFDGDWRDFLSGWGVNTISCVNDDSTYLLSLVKSEGGDEGGGEYVERVIRVDANGEILGYVMINGYYMSYDGTTYDDSSEFTTVEPHEVTVIQYRQLV